ncbi:E2-like conjugating enzyme atg10 [Sticta canariensis]|nr:E2-like conjugating enzyme atg10 [Sticta canariensis]
MSDELAISTLTSSPPRQRHFDGSITEAGFCFGAQGLAAAWNLHPDCHNSWTWVPVASQSSIEQVVVLMVAGFLHLERAVQSSEPISRGDSVQDSLELSDEQPAEAETSSVHLYDYHIVYNASYGVPVLMFQGHATGAAFPAASPDLFWTDPQMATSDPAGHMQPYCKYSVAPYAFKTSAQAAFCVYILTPAARLGAFCFCACAGLLPMHLPRAGLATKLPVGYSCLSPTLWSLYTLYAKIHQGSATPGVCADGRPLEWTEILADMPKAFREAAGSHNRWTFVTQQVQRSALSYHLFRFVVSPLEGVCKNDTADICSAPAVLRCSSGCSDEACLIVSLWASLITPAAILSAVNRMCTQQTSSQAPGASW